MKLHLDIFREFHKDIPATNKGPKEIVFAMLTEKLGNSRIRKEMIRYVVICKKVHNTWKAKKNYD